VGLHSEGWLGLAEQGRGGGGGGGGEDEVRCVWMYSIVVA